MVDQNPLEHGDFTPYFQVAKLFEEIMTSAGFTYTSNFLSRIDDTYLALYNGDLSIQGTENPNGYTLLVGFQSDTTLTPASSNTYYPITLSDTTPFFDTGSRWVTDTYTAPFRARYRLRLNVLGEMSDTSHEITIAVTVNGTPVWIPIEDEEGGVFNGNFYSFLLSSEGVFLNAGDTLRLEYKMNTGGESQCHLHGCGIWSRENESGNRFSNKPHLGTDGRCCRQYARDEANRLRVGASKDVQSRIHSGSQQRQTSRDRAVQRLHGEWSFEGLDE